MAEAAEQGWSTRALERKISTLYYERLLASSDRAAFEKEAFTAVAPLQIPRDFVRDPVMLEFLGLPGLGRLLESDLEQARLDNLQAFLLELGRGPAFVGRQYRISTETKDFFVRLVFFNFLLKCFVLFDLKAGELRRAHQAEAVSNTGLPTGNSQLAGEQQPQTGWMYIHLCLNVAGRCEVVVERIGAMRIKAKRQRICKP